MASFKTEPAPRLKRKAAASKHKLVPFTEDDATDLQTAKCFGLLHDSAVIVRGPADIQALIQHGCFGKGVFSRSIPIHGRLPHPKQRQLRRKERLGEELEDSEFELAQEKRMKLHLEWRKEQEAYFTEHSMEEESSPSPPGETSSSVIPLEGSCSVTTDESVTSGASSAETKTFADEMQQISVPFGGNVEKAGENPTLAKAKADPYRVTEYLQLSSEEAFYLVNHLEILEVSDADGEQYSPCQLWSYFCSLSKCFLENYMAYQYYRKKGWVPKSGLKFGVTFLLYKDSPAVYHSSYAVVVRLVERSGPGLSERELCTTGLAALTWHEVVSLCRVNESAAKDLVLCCVTKPPALTERELQSPDCLSKFTVQEVFVGRWVPDRERTS